MRDMPIRFGLKTVFVTTTLVALGLAAYSLRPIDGFGAVDDFTYYAPGYSNSAWREICIGAKRQNVYARLGLPQCVIDRGGGDILEEWSSTFMHNTRYRRRALGFKGDTVVFKKNEITTVRAHFRMYLNTATPPGAPIFE
jgi:hypothetical protein